MRLLGLDLRQVVLDHCKQQLSHVVVPDDYHHAEVALSEGNSVTIRDLLYLMLLTKRNEYLTLYIIFDH
jgi:hypothetical protein